MLLLPSLFNSYNVQLLYVFDDYKLMHWPLFICRSGQILSCTLWDTYCLQFLEYLNEAENDVPIIIILTHARIKEVQGIASCQICQFLCLLNNILCVLFVTNVGSYPPSDSNSLKSSKLLINEPVFEIQEFNERFFSHGLGPVFINFLNYMCRLFFPTVLVYSMSIGFLI